MEVRDFPDAQEYTLLACDLAQLQAPLIEIGPGAYPSRYPPTVPLLFAPFTPFTFFNPSHFHWIARGFGLVTVILIALSGRWLLGSRLAGAFAALLWALHPETVRLATMPMSETGLAMISGC